METTSPPSEGNLKPLIVAAAVIAAAAVIWGFRIDAQNTITQPQLFWAFLVFGLVGSLLGWRIAMRNDPDPLRNLIGLVGSLVAWRVSYFPFMVVAGWKASLGEWLTFNTLEVSIVYPTFLLFMFAQHAGVGFIGAAAVASPRTPAPANGRLLFFRKLFHKPPRKALWALACVALPVACMVSFSTGEDFRLLNDSPAPDMAAVEIHQPKLNPYGVIMTEHELAPAPWVLALNARLTYPLVPHSPWATAMAGTLERLTLDNPLASTRDRIDEHYQAWIASHARIHDPLTGATP
ncbi:MAG: hypothetical protein K8I27_07865 [Planctomycetes bacterium]|nr:hypothetical protein [Planctomycetota bacterium]